MKEAAPPRRIVHLVRDPQALNLAGWRAAPAAGPGPKALGRRRALVIGEHRLLDGLLQGVEIVALVGLVWTLFSALALLRAGRAEAAQVAPPAAAALARPAGAPEMKTSGAPAEDGSQPPAILTQVQRSGGGSPLELPGGRFPLIDAAAAPSLALSPLPLDLPLNADDAPELEAPLATRLLVPAIQVDALIVQGDGWEDLKQGVGQHPGTGAPGVPGNVVLSAHNDVYGKIFRHLNQLQIGDEILLSNGVTTFRYQVDWKKIVRPGRVDLMQPTDYPSVTLISCYPYGVDTHRIVVTARLIGKIDANP